MSARLFGTEWIQPPLPKHEKITSKEPTANPPTPKQEPHTKIQTVEQKTPQIPPKPVMSAEAAVYPKLLRIYKELNRQNGIIFNAERERNELELERDNLKGFVKLTKKRELQSRIDRKSYNAYIACKEQVAKWEKIYGDDSQKQNKKSVLERLRNPPKKTADYQQQGLLREKTEGQDSPLVFVKYNNFSMMNTPKYDIIDL